MITTIRIDKVCKCPQELHNEMCDQVFKIGNGFATTDADFYKDDIIVAYSNDSRIIGMWTFLGHCSIKDLRGKDDLLGGGCVFFKWFGWHNNKLSVFGIDANEICRSKFGLQHDCLTKEEIFVKFNNITDALTFFNVLTSLGYKFKEPDLTSVWNPSKEFVLYANYEKHGSFYFSFGKRRYDNNYDKIDCETFLWQCGCYKKGDDQVTKYDSTYITNAIINAMSSDNPVLLNSTASQNEYVSEYPFSLWDDTSVTKSVQNVMSSVEEADYIKTIEELEKRLEALEQMVKNNNNKRNLHKTNGYHVIGNNSHSHYSKPEDDDPYTNFLRYGSSSTF